MVGKEDARESLLTYTCICHRRLPCRRHSQSTPRCYTIATKCLRAFHPPHAHQRPSTGSAVPALNVRDTGLHSRPKEETAGDDPYSSSEHEQLTADISGTVAGVVTCRCCLPPADHCGSASWLSKGCDNPRSNSARPGTIFSVECAGPHRRVW